MSSTAHWVCFNSRRIQKAAGDVSDTHIAAVNNAESHFPSFVEAHIITIAPRPIPCLGEGNFPHNASQHASLRQQCCAGSRWLLGAAVRRQQSAMQSLKAEAQNLGVHITPPPQSSQTCGTALFLRMLPIKKNP